MPSLIDPSTAVEEKRDCKLDAFDVCINWRVQEEMDAECNLKINDYCVWAKDQAVQEDVIPRVQDMFLAIPEDTEKYQYPADLEE